MESSRHQFKNQYGSFTSVLVVVLPTNQNEFLVRTVIRKKQGQPLLLKSVKKWFPSEKYQDFMNDLKLRINN